MSYEPCDACAVHRADGRFEQALACFRCAGTGLVPTRDAAICNGCGQSLHPPTGSIDAQIPHGLANFEIIGGYDSEGLLDLHRYTFSLCERCLRGILAKTKIPPLVERLNDGGERWERILFADDQRAWEYNEWRRRGGHATAAIHGLCNAIKDCGTEAAYAISLSGDVGDDRTCEAHKDRWNFCVNAKLLPIERRS